MFNSFDTFEVCNKIEGKLWYFILSELLFLKKSIELSRKWVDYWSNANMDISVDGPWNGGEVEWEISNDWDYLFIEELLELNSLSFAIANDGVEFVVERLVKFILFTHLLCVDNGCP